jgi:hypothetical protein
VASSGKHYPLEFRRFIKKQHCAERSIEFRDHNVLFRELVDWVVDQGIPGDFAFDSWFAHKANLAHIHSRGRAYVGDLKFNRKILFKGEELSAAALAGRIAPADRQEIRFGGQRQWYFTVTVRIGVGPSGSDRDPLEASPRRDAAEDSDHESDPVGDHADSAGL